MTGCELAIGNGRSQIAAVRALSREERELMIGPRDPTKRIIEPMVRGGRKDTRGGRVSEASHTETVPFAC